MTALEAYVTTTRAARYVEQLSSHFTHQPGGMRLLADDPERLLVDLNGVTWLIRAEDDRLLLRLEADDPTHLNDASAHVTQRIEQIGRRDDLRVTWHPA